MKHNSDANTDQRANEMIMRTESENRTTPPPFTVKRQQIERRTESGVDGDIENDSNSRRRAETREDCDEREEPSKRELNKLTKRRVTPPSPL